jgi:hypothetical protein
MKHPFISYKVNKNCYNMLKFIKAFKELYDYSPNYVEAGAYLSLSTLGAMKVFRRLKKMEMVDDRPSDRRTMVITLKGRNFLYKFKTWESVKEAKI